VLWLVEWPERGAAALPAADLHVSLAVEGAGRSARLTAGSATGEQWLARVRTEGQLQASSLQSG
jgi:tRNA threonylcarbamoyladenosine biosynthesis protein TsaE